MTSRRPRVPAETIAIPTPDAPLEEIWSFAATYDAYGHLGQDMPASIANRWWGEYLRPDHPPPDGTVVELRAALSFEWCRYRHLGHQPTGIDEQYIRSLVTPRSLVPAASSTQRAVASTSARPRPERGAQNLTD